MHHAVNLKMENGRRREHGNDGFMALLPVTVRKISNEAHSVEILKVRECAESFLQYVATTVNMKCHEARPATKLSTHKHPINRRQMFVVACRLYMYIQ